MRSWPGDSVPPNGSRLFDKLVVNTKSATATTACLAIGGVQNISHLPARSSPALIRKDLLRAVPLGQPNVAGVEIKEIDFAPNQQMGLHRHPCPVVSYVAAGTIRFQVEGGPIQVLPAGRAFFEPADARIAHFDNASPREPARFIAFHLPGPNDQQLIEMLASPPSAKRPRADRSSSSVACVTALAFVVPARSTSRT